MMLNGNRTWEEELRAGSMNGGSMNGEVGLGEYNTP